MSATPLTFKAGGTLQEGHFYIRRPADDLLPAALLRGDFCYVLAPRQMGKSSLRYRTAQHLAQQGVHCASIDLTALGGETTTPAEWYYGLLDDIAKQVGGEPLRNQAEEFWIDHEQAAPVKRFMRFVRESLLAQTTGPIVLFVDEIDAVRALPFSSDDFFAALRAAYNARPDDAEYKRLRVCLLGVAQPGDLIRNELITPFNIGTRIDLADFARDQLDELSQGLQPTGAKPSALLDATYSWTHGHPYMVQRLCAALAPAEGVTAHIAPGSEAIYLADCVDEMFLRRSGVRDTNLAYAEKSFSRTGADPRIPKMLALYGRMLRGETVPADGRDAIQGALQLTGMAAVRTSGARQVLEIRNRIFATVFDAAWVRRQQSDRLLHEPMSRWLDSGRKDDFVLRGDALREAEQWLDGRDDITGDEQHFLLACLRVTKHEESSRAETALLAEKAARIEAERVEAIASAERANAEVARAEATAAQIERARAAAVAQAQMRTRTNRLLGAIVVTLLLALLSVYSQYRRVKQEETQKAQALLREQQALNREKEERQRAERLTLVERGARAKLLAQLPSDLDALRLGLQAIDPTLTKGQTPPAEAIEGLTAAALAVGYPLFSPWQHDKAVNVASFSPDGARVVTASEDGTARLWDAKSGSPLATFAENHDLVLAAMFSPDGATILAASANGNAYIFDTRLERYIDRACGILRTHPDDYKEVAAICSALAPSAAP